jgi:hypothetical protein
VAYRANDGGTVNWVGDVCWLLPWLLLLLVAAALSHEELNLEKGKGAEGPGVAAAVMAAAPAPPAEAELFIAPAEGDTAAELNPGRRSSPAPGLLGCLAAVAVVAAMEPEPKGDPGDSGGDDKAMSPAWLLLGTRRCNTTPFVGGSEGGKDEAPTAAFVCAA